MLFRAYVLSIVFSWFCASSFYVPWDNGYNIEPAVPRDVIVHVINDLGLALLEAHNENNNNNIALSPYGAASVLIALSEGVQGAAFEEIKHALRQPSDTSVMRVGLRDIHRHLKSYFIPKEGFLAGLTLSRDNITIKPEFEEILKFYGYDIETFNNPLYPDPYTTAKTSSILNETDVTSTTLETTQFTKEYMEEDVSESSTLETDKLTKEYMEEDVSESTTLETVQLTKEYMEKDVSESTTLETVKLTKEYMEKDVSESTTLETVQLTKEYMEKDVSESTTLETVQLTKEYMEENVSETTTLETIQSTKEYMDEGVLELNETTSTLSNLSEKLVMSNTDFKETTTFVPSTMDFAGNDISVLDHSESKSTISAISTVTETESTIKPSEVTTNTHKETTTESNIDETMDKNKNMSTTTGSTPIVTTDIQRTTYSTIRMTSTITKKTSRAIPTTVMSTIMAETNKTAQQINLDMSNITTTDFFTTKYVTEGSTIGNTQKITEINSEQLENTTTNFPTTQTVTEIETTPQIETTETTNPSTIESTTETTNPSTIESTTETTDSTTETFTATTDNESITETTTENSFSNRTKRSVIDYVIARYYDNYHINNNHNHKEDISYEPEKHFSFLVNGKIRETNINFMTYDTVLPFAFVPNLNCLALGFPLDNIKYYLLLLLPVEDDGINKLIFDLKQAGNLKEIIDSLKYSRVKASIPSFMLKGYVVLTPTLQKLGIRKIFEPRQADFSPMTNDRGTYVTNIEQAVTVTIRNYVDPNTLLQNYRYLHQYGTVEFKADHPFLYFVIDSDIHVTLMAGKIVNPLNSRIR